MESSRFIQLSEQILIEYIYTSQATPTTFNTANYPIELMRDANTQGTYFFNTDSVSAVMGNYRDISGAAIDENKSQPFLIMIQKLSMFLWTPILAFLIMILVLLLLTRLTYYKHLALILT